MTTSLFLLAAYVLGSIPFAIVVSRAFRLQDPRTVGSGNPGATNVLRSGNKLAAALTLLGDAGKGWLAVWLAWRLAPWQSLATEHFVVLAGLAAFIGHVFPVFLRFRGGKGVATALGVILGLHAGLGLAAAGVWLGVAAVSRYSSLAALAAALSTPFLAALFGLSLLSSGALLGMASLLLWRHKENLRRLRNGTEPRIGARKERSVA